MVRKQQDKPLPSIALASPPPTPSAMTSRPLPQQPTKRVPKPGLQGPEKQLLDAKLLELQLGLLSLDEVRSERRKGGRTGTIITLRRGTHTPYPHNTHSP